MLYYVGHTGEIRLSADRLLTTFDWLTTNHVILGWLSWFHKQCLILSIAAYEKPWTKRYNGKILTAWVVDYCIGLYETLYTCKYLNKSHIIIVKVTNILLSTINSKLIKYSVDHNNHFCNALMKVKLIMKVWNILLANLNIIINNNKLEWWVFILAIKIDAVIVNKVDS